MRTKQLDHNLLDEPYSFEFFQAVRLLYKIYHFKKPVGGDALPHEEAVRFRTKISLDFPPSQIDSILRVEAETGEAERLEMLVNFMGMLGSSGAMPMHYTELAFDRLRYRDTTLWSFLDIFTHRSISSFFRAWSKYRFPIGYEGGEDQFAAYLFDFVGLGTRGMLGRLDVVDESLLPYTGIISQKPHSTNAIQNLISDYFGVGVHIQQFFGQWLTLNEQDTIALGKRSSVLGRTAIAGKSVWDQQSKFRIRLGPLTLQQYQAFLPNGTGYKPLGSLVKLMVGLEFDYDIQLVLKDTQVPACILTTRAKRRPMLGWTSFLKTEPFTKDDDQLVLGLGE
jgi:type VI secretion system protein ImpH